MSAEKTARLDKQHGFLRQIIKNQIDRDEYDKVVKAQHKQQRRQRNQAWKRPDKNIYTPPTKKSVAAVNDAEDDNPRKEELLQIEYVNQEDQVSNHTIYEGDDPRKVASMIGRKEGLSQPYVQALCEIIWEKLDHMKTGT